MMTDNYKAGSLSLTSAVATGTGVMIGAGIFALTGQVAEFAGRLFPLAFFIAAIISGFRSVANDKPKIASPAVSATK